MIINNSFLFRDQFQTNKNPSYLCMMAANGSDFNIKNLALVDGIQVNSDFKYISKKSKNLPNKQSITTAIEDELASLGRMVFILIGQVNATEQFSETINHSLFNEIQIDPTLPNSLSVAQPLIQVQNLPDEELLLDELEKAVPLPDNFFKPFHDAYIKLKKKCFASLQVPKPGEKVTVGFLDEVANALARQAVEYHASLQKCGPQLDQNQAEFNNVLRIAYDFESDAVRILRLLMSVCDLKPIILWMTLSAHHNLSEAFRCLPRSRDQNKPSLSNYREMIHGARNRAFHNLLPFGQSIQVDLDGINIKAKRLRLFSEYKLKSENVFDFEDKQLVEILTEFTRADEKYVTPDFWKRNHDVMIATAQLVAAVSDAIKALNLLHV
ncbi:MAG TPA: hypothetical protein PLO13_06745 [Anaerolineaceae bacterium]|nr:hypothetical protein [Anaerolineaceae bacterium]